MPKNKKRQKTRTHNSRIQKKLNQIQQLNPWAGAHFQKLQRENEALKSDPETVVGQVITQLRDEVHKNKRLSVLAAAIIKQAGGSIKLKKEDLEGFENLLLSIKWELPEGVEKVEDAEEFTFTYEALTQEEVAARQAEAQAAAAPQVTLTPVEGQAELEQAIVEEAAEDAAENVADIQLENYTNYESGEGDTAPVMAAASEEAIIDIDDSDDPANTDYTVEDAAEEL
jgi:hypothetical protein